MPLQHYRASAGGCAFLFGPRVVRLRDEGLHGSVERAGQRLVLKGVVERHLRLHQQDRRDATPPAISEGRQR